MGRRNINTTKSGKYMNPTDQARKEARKKELKKNKKQRQMVRAAVLKGKDPTQLIVEMEKMDQMEYNVEIPPALSEKVLKDKRKKLRETLDRVLKLYEKENPEYWVEIRRMVSDYEKKRANLIEYYEAVKHAQAVTVDEIPLPNLDMPAESEDCDMDEQGAFAGSIEGVAAILPHHLPQMEGGAMMPHSILKKHHQLLPQHQMLSQQQQQMLLQQPPIPGEEIGMAAPHQMPTQVKLPPGCPPTVCPELSDIEDDEESEMLEQRNRTKRIRFEDENADDDDLRGNDSDNENKRRSRRKGGDDSTDDELDDDRKSSESAKAAKSQGLTSLQAKLLQLSGQDVDQFVRETEVLLQEKEADKQADLRRRLSKLKDSEQPPMKDIPQKVSTDHPPPSMLPPAPGEGSDSVSALSESSHGNPVPVAPPLGGMYSMAPPVGIPPVPVAPPHPSSLPQLPTMFRPPPPRPGMPPPPPMAVRLPPGPPPQNLSQIMPGGVPPPRLPNMRLPPPVRAPVAPPGVMIPRPSGPPPPSAPGAPASNVLSAAPQLVSRPTRMGNPHTATIQAKPQIRNLSADITRFLPTALRVKREDKKKGSKTEGKEAPIRPEEQGKRPTKEDAYSQFMREMEDLL